MLVGDIVGIQEGTFPQLCCYHHSDAELQQLASVHFPTLTLNLLTTGLYVTSPNDSSHPEDNWGCVITYLKSVSRSNTTASIKNLNLDFAAAATDSKQIFAFRAITDELGDSTISPDTMVGRSRHLNHTIKVQRGHSQEDDDEEEGEAFTTSKQKVRRIVELLRVCCSDAGVFDISDETSEGKTQFVSHETIQRYVGRCLSCLKACGRTAADPLLSLNWLRARKFGRSQSHDAVLWTVDRRPEASTLALISPLHGPPCSIS